MDKYTIDIDKVLDDFEEREALQVKQTGSVENKDIETWFSSKKTEANPALPVNRCQQNQTSYVHREHTFSHPSVLHHENLCHPHSQSEMEPLDEIDLSEADFAPTLKTFPTQATLNNHNVNTLSYEMYYKSFQPPGNKPLDRQTHTPQDNIDKPENVNFSGESHTTAATSVKSVHDDKQYRLADQMYNVAVKNADLKVLNDGKCSHSNVASECLMKCGSSSLQRTYNNTEDFCMNKNIIPEPSNGLCKNLLDDSNDILSGNIIYNSPMGSNCDHISVSACLTEANDVETEVNSETNGVHDLEPVNTNLSESYSANSFSATTKPSLCNKFDCTSNPVVISSEPQNWRDEGNDAVQYDFVLQQSKSVLRNAGEDEQGQFNGKLDANNAVATKYSWDSLNARNSQIDTEGTKSDTLCNSVYEALSPSVDVAYEDEPDDDNSMTCTSSYKPVGFHDTEDNECLNIADINEYLGEVSDLHSMQDEDSGVSSQEGDINGNSMLPYAPNKNDQTISECHSNVTVSKTDIDSVEDENVLPDNMFTVVQSSQYQGSICSSEICEGEESANIKEHFKPHETIPCNNIENSEIDLALEKGNVFPGARPKQKEKGTDLLVVSDNISCADKPVIFIQSVDVPISDKNGETGMDNVNLSIENNYASVNGFDCSNSCVPRPEQEIVHEDDMESFSSDKNDEYNVDSSENSSCSPPRLQRPTTLDLPSRSIMKPLEDCTDEDSVLPSCDSVIEESLNTSLSNEQHILDESSQTGDYSIMQCDIESQVEQPTQLGIVKPFWIPDEEAPNCMHCPIKFNVFKRRHHCRACGKVLCSRCCNQKARLPYLQNKEDRVCQQCYLILLNASKLLAAGSGESPSSSSCGSSPNFSPTSLTNRYSPKRPHPNNPDDYCSTIPPLQQAQQSLNCPPPTVMVPVGVLKRGNKPRGEPKQVIFSDGIRPGGDLTDLTETVENVPPYHRQGGRRRIDKAITPSTDNSLLNSGVPSATSNKKPPHPKNRHKRIIVSDSEGPLPPVLLPIDTPSDVKPDMDMLLLHLQDTEKRPAVFAPTKNMHVLAKITKLDCCFGKECWCFTSHGLCTVGQDEVMVILERLENENSFPRDIFKLYRTIYDNASKGTTVGELGHVIFPEGILGSSEPRGFLFVRPTLQCLSNLVVPNTPFLVAILIQKWELPWAKVFPLRLMLRLGTESRYYPCSLLSVRLRKPVYLEIGPTIMSVLADLRNYQFSLPVIPGLVIHMEGKKTCVNIPRNRYEKVLKVINSNNVEHVLALGSNFSTEADSYLVCVQNDEGDYQTQAMNIDNTPRRVTGASFIVFSGALKSSSGLTAKFSIVEDGLLVQILPETMAALQSALTDMRDLTIACGQINSPEVGEVVILQWVRDDRKFNIGVRSPVDSRSLEGVQSVRIHTSTDYAAEHYLIRWTEVFFLELDENGNSKRNDCIDPSRLAEAVAQACCMSLTPYLEQLADADLTKIGLRVTLDSEGDKVEYEVGSRGKPLPSAYMNALDSGLIPVISRVSGSSQDGPVSLELIFYILIK